MAVITVVGSGMMGTALTWPLSKNNHTIRLVGTPLDEEIISQIKSCGVHPKLQRKIPSSVSTYQIGKIQQAITGTDLIISGVSSFGVNWFAEQIGPLFTPEVPVLSVTKGLHLSANSGLMIFPDLINSLLPPKLQGQININAIGGPFISH